MIFTGDCLEMIHFRWVRCVSPLSFGRRTQKLRGDIILLTFCSIFIVSLLIFLIAILLWLLKKPMKWRFSIRGMARLLVKLLAINALTFAIDFPNNERTHVIFSLCHLDEWSISFSRGKTTKVWYCAILSLGRMDMLSLCQTSHRNTSSKISDRQTNNIFLYNFENSFHVFL